MARARSLVLLPLLAGLFVTAVMASNRGADSTFVASEQSPGPLTAAKLEALVRQAPGGKGLPADARTRAKCVSHGSGQLRNPWTCVIRYHSGERLRYRVEVARDGSFVGHKSDGRINGCCLEFGPRD